MAVKGIQNNLNFKYALRGLFGSLQQIDTTGLPALEAVLRDVELAAPDEVLVGGDLVGRGPEGSAVVQRIRERDGLNEAAAIDRQIATREEALAWVGELLDRG